MGSEWEMRPLGELADLHQEQVNPADFPGQLFEHYSLPAFDAGQIPVREAGSSIGSQKFTVPRDAILLSKLNPRIPRVWKPEVASDLPAVASTEFLVLLPKDRIDRAFLKYACLSPSVREELQARVTGTSGSHQRVRPDDALTIEISIPVDPGEQRAIAYILGTLDDKIELNRKMNETLEAMARAIFKSWFVDFDPVRAKMEGRWKKGESLPGLPAELWDLFPSEFEESEIGEIPKEWKVASVSSAIEVNPERRLSKGQAAPYVDMGHLPTASARVLGSIDRPFTSGSHFQNGDVLVARITPCLENGKTAYVDFLDGRSIAWGSTEFLVLSSKPPLPKEWAYCLARTEKFRSHLIQNMSGTSGRQRAPAECLDSFPIASPSPDIAGRFGQVVGPWFAKMKVNDVESSILAEARDALLPKLLSGKIRVPVNGGR